MGKLDRIKRDLQQCSVEELEELAHWIQERKVALSSFPTEPVRNSSRSVVRTLTGVTPNGEKALWQLEYVRCGKQRCHKCREGAGHGPYWYYYWREGSKTKLKSKYWGKRNPLQGI